MLVVAFVAHQRRRAAAGRVTLLDLTLFTIPSFRRGNVAALTVSLGQFGILFALPLWLQNALGYTALESGAALLPLAAASFLAGGVGGVLTDRYGPARTVQLGLACEVAGVAWLAAVIAVDTPWWATVPALAVYGFGVGLATAQLGNVVLADVPPSRSGQASGTETTAQELGSALGIAVLGTVLFTELGRSLTERRRGHRRAGRCGPRERGRGHRRARRRPGHGGRGRRGPSRSHRRRPHRGLDRVGVPGTGPDHEPAPAQQQPADRRGRGAPEVLTR